MVKGIFGSLPGRLLMKHKFAIFSIFLAFILISSGCGTAGQLADPSNTPAPPTDTKIPPTSTQSPPTQTPLPPTDTPLPPTRTPFPESCLASDSSILEIILSFETLVNEKDLEGTMDMFSEQAVFEESHRGLRKEGTADIKAIWGSYYRLSPQAEFRNIVVCENMATFIWAELNALNDLVWPVLLEVQDGKITYMDFYDKATWGDKQEE
jgi:hypothetical protein